MVRTVLVVLALSGMLLAGCSMKVVPQPVESGRINPADNSLTVARNGVAVTVRNSEQEMARYNLSGVTTSFFVSVANKTDKEMSFSRDNMVLLDASNRQYHPLSLESLNKLLSKDAYYLLPYPYVGFYYMEDYERTFSNATINSQQPYFYEVYHRDIETGYLPEGTIVPKAHVSGQVYFNLDLATTSGVKLLIYMKGSSKSSDPDFVFPFTVQK